MKINNIFPLTEGDCVTLQLKGQKFNIGTYPILGMSSMKFCVQVQDTDEQVYTIVSEYIIKIKNCHFCFRSASICKPLVPILPSDIQEVKSLNDELRKFGLHIELTSGDKKDINANRNT